MNGYRIFVGKVVHNHNIDIGIVFLAIPHEHRIVNRVWVSECWVQRSDSLLKGLVRLGMTASGKERFQPLKDLKANQIVN